MCIRGFGRSPAGQALLPLGLACLLIPFALAAQSWPVPEAIGRVHLERARKASWPAPAGWAQIWPAGLDPKRCGVAVYTATGRPVSARILWSAPGEPLTICFDTSNNEGSYDAYLCSGPVQAPAWQPQAGVLLETRPLKAGAWGSWDQAWRLYQGTEAVLGCSVMSNIFQGIHPHGPTADFSGHCNAWLTVKKAGSHSFALVATGPACLRVNGKVVVQRLQTGGSRGRRGEYNGSVELKPGRHQLEILFAHPGGGEWTLEAAWKEPEGGQYFQVIPKEAFVPLARFDSFSWTPAPGRAARGAFEWEMLHHSLVRDTALVTVQLRAVGGRKDANCAWEFDDGSAARGAPALHVFPQVGLRRIQFNADAASPGAPTLADQINVRPNWSQLEEWNDAFFEQQKKQLLASSLGATPPEDLLALVKLAGALTDRPLLSHLGAACLKRQAEFKPYQAEAFPILGRHFQAPEVGDYLSAEKAWRAAVALATPDLSLHDKAKLRLAQLLTDAFNRPAEALALLKGLQKANLLSDDVRLATLLEADALAAQGKVEEAVALCRKAGNLAPQTALRQSVRGAARLESARDLILRGEFDAAGEILREIEWETPLERLSGDTGLPMILVFLGRKEYPLALSRCQRLLHSAAVDTQRAHVLHSLIETELALGQESAARETLRKLLKDHPYSEAAARAKDRWSDHLAPK